MRLLTVAALTVLVVLLLDSPSLSSPLPTVCICILVRNKEHSLPYFLGALERLDYPKENILLWMMVDHSVDKSQEVVDKWLAHARHLYRQVNYLATLEPKAYEGQRSDVEWTDQRMQHVSALKTAAMAYAEEFQLNYLFYLDADAILMNPDTLGQLISLNKPVVAPMLNSTGLYSNFWGAMDENGYYLRSDDYIAIKNRHMTGVFGVPMVHSAVLIDIKHKATGKLSFQSVPDAPPDDIIVFALSAKNSGVPIYVVNTEFYGYIPVPRGEEENLTDEVVHWRELVTSRKVMDHLELIPEPFSYDAVATSKLGFDEIYMINLLRRSDRAEKTKRVLRLFNIGYRHFPAADGQQFNSSYLESIGVKMLEGYLDPYYNRPLKMGEVGCFLSHYFVWEDMVKNGYKRILILEDDPFLVPNFVEDLQLAFADADRLVPNWELIFVGRKIMHWKDEYYVTDSKRLVYPAHSHWTVAYALSAAGANKFIAEKPLSKMVAVDEFIPIMYNKSNNVQWLSHFKNRDLVALSVDPLLIHPHLYTNEPGHYSDTEASDLIETVVSNPESSTLHSQTAAAKEETLARGEL